MVRRARGCHLGEYVVAGGNLLVGERKRQHALKRGRARAVHHVRGGGGAGAAVLRLFHKRQLKQQQLFVHQAAARLGHLVHGLREMDARKRLRARHKAELRAQVKRQRVIAAAYHVKGVFHDAAHPRGRDFLARGMHGDDHALGRLPRLKRLQVGVHHALEAVVELNLAGHGNGHARLELVF